MKKITKNSPKNPKDSQIKPKAKPLPEKKPTPKSKAKPNQADLFVEKYLEFYDDIKIPTRRYDW